MSGEVESCKQPDGERPKSCGYRTPACFIVAHKKLLEANAVTCSLIAASSCVKQAMISIIAAAAFGAMAMEDGGKLEARCGKRDTFCYGYIAGVRDQVHSAESLKSRPTICDKDETLGEVVDIVEKDLMSHPEYKDRIAADLVYGALLKAYPCPHK